MPRLTSQAAAAGGSTPKPGPTREARSPAPARGVEELTERNVRLIQQLERAERRRRSKLEGFADRICELAGSTGFLMIHVVWFGGWIGYNALAGAGAFDPFPFTFLTLVVSLEAIFLSTFILISQARDARIGAHRNQLDLQMDLLTEQQNTKVLHLLESIAAKLGIDERNDADLKALEQPTPLERLVQQIEKAERKTRAAP